MAGNDWLALPRIVRLMWSNFCSLKFITKCLKTGLKLEGVSPWQWNLGKLKFWICSGWFSYFFPCIFHCEIQLDYNEIWGRVYLYFSWSTFQICVQLHHISVNKAPGIFNVLWNCPSDLFEMSGVDQNHRKLEVMAVCVFRVVHLFHGNRSARKYMIAHVMQFTIHIINPLYMGMDASR